MWLGRDSNWWSSDVMHPDRQVLCLLHKPVVTLNQCIIDLSSIEFTPKNTSRKVRFVLSTYHVWRLFFNFIFRRSTLCCSRGFLPRVALNFVFKIVLCVVKHIYRSIYYPHLIPRWKAIRYLDPTNISKHNHHNSSQTTVKVEQNYPWLQRPVRKWIRDRPGLHLFYVYHV